MLTNLLHNALATAGGSNGRPGNANDFWYKMIGYPSETGIAVSPDKLMSGQSGLVYTCMRILGNAVMVMPMQVYERADDGSRKVARGHPLYETLHRRPNRWQTPGEFKVTMTVNAALRGWSHALIDYDGGGRASLRPLNPDRVRGKLLQSGRVVYEVSSAKTGEVVEVQQENMFTLRLMTLDGGVTPVKPIMAAKNTIGLGVAAETYAGGTFKSGGLPLAVLTHPQQLNDDARKRLSDHYIDTYGPAAARKAITVLDEGVKIEPVGITPEESQLLDTQKFTREQIAAIWGIPLFLVNAMEKGASFASLSEVKQAFYDFCLLPWATLWEESVDRDLLADPKHFAEMNADVYLRASPEKRALIYNLSWWMTGNEIRRSENLAPMPQKWMNEPQAPLNRGNPGGTAEAPNRSNNSPGARVAVARLVADAVAKITRREARELPRAADKSAFLKEHGEYARKTLSPLAEMVRDVMAYEMPVEDVLAEHLGQLAALTATGIYPDAGAADLKAQELTASLINTARE
jgi:HK97 family phage portal protein